jgi:monovalent cation:H+ antiporter-2, CPA2 family
METNPILFRDLTYIFVAALVGGLAAWRLRVPLILGFVLGGMAISPFTPGPQLSDLHTFEVFSEVGIVLLMFSAGAEFSIRDLMRVKWVALVGAPIGIFFMIGIGGAVAKLAGWNVTEAVVIGTTISAASTMVLLRLLSDVGNTDTPFGRVAAGIALVSELTVICITVVLPAFGSSEKGLFSKAAWTLGKALILLFPLAFLAIKVIPTTFRRVKLTCSPELFLLIVIAVCLVTAALAREAGFSFAVGAFLAGFSISGLPDLHEANTQLAPLRNAFAALFFVSLGALIEPELLFKSLPLLGVMLLFIVLGKFLIWTAITRLFGYPISTAIVVGSALTQIGEFSFVVVQVAWSSGIVSEHVFSTTIAASLISIFLNVFIARRAFGRFNRSAGDKSALDCNSDFLLEKVL